MAGAAPTAKPAPFLKPLDLLDRGILLGETAMCLVIVAAMVLLTSVSALAGLAHIRHPFLTMAGDLLPNATLWAAFLGASYATRGRRHLAIDVVGKLLPVRPRHAVAAIAATLGSVVAFALARGIYEALLEQAHIADQLLREMTAGGMAKGQVDRSYQFHFAIPAGFLLIGIRLAMHGFHEFMASARSGEEEPTEESAIEEEPTKAAPISSAGPVESVIAVAVVVAVAAISAGSSIALQAIVGMVLAAAVLLVPLALRWKKTGSLQPTVPVPQRMIETVNVAEIASGLVGVAAVYGVAWYLIGRIPEIPIGYGVAFFAFMALIGAPLFTFLGGLALFLWTHGTADVMPQPLSSAAEDVLGNHFARMSVLPTIPLFTLAGYLMSESKTAERIVRMARAWLGFMPGGLAVVCVLASAAFTVFSGASGITIVAIGGLLFPALIRDRFPEKFSLGLVTTGGALGITFFPALPLIVYGIIAGLQEKPAGVEENLQLDKFLFAGTLPGLLIIGMLIVYAMIMGVKHKVPREPFNGREAIASFVAALPEMMIAPIVMGGFYAFGPTPAAALAVLYVFIIQVFFYKDLSLTRDIPRIVPESMTLVGAIFVKICAATVLAMYFVEAQTGDKLFEFLTCGQPAMDLLAKPDTGFGTCREAVAALADLGQSSGGIIDSKLKFLLALNLFLLVAGMLMDIFSAIVVIVPLILGMALFFGINPYHLGIVFLLNLEIGYLMPPMGLNLFIAAFRFRKPVQALYTVVLPFIGIFAVALAVTTYVPWLTLVLVPDAEKASMHREPAAAPMNLDGTAAPADAAAAGADCDVPRVGESIEDMDKRCGTGDAAPLDGAAPAGAAPAAIPCGDVPAPGESLDAYMVRCP